MDAHGRWSPSWAKCVTSVWPDGSKDTVATPRNSSNGLAIGPDGAGYVCNSGGWRFLEFGGLRVTDLEQPTTSPVAASSASTW